MAKHDFIQTQKGFFSSYWDTGLYGNYFQCDPKYVGAIMQHNAEAYAGKYFITQIMLTKLLINSFSEPKERSTTRCFITRLKTTSLNLLLII